jgi:hypothetical protein
MLKFAALIITHEKISTRFLHFFCLIVNAQLDTEHWFAPMSASSLQGTPNAICTVYQRNDSFSVQISNNNIVISTVQVSKNNPVQITIPNNFMIASTSSTFYTKFNGITCQRK